MRCYEIRQCGEPVALVANLELAQAITQCQSPGHYLVDEVEVGEPPAPPRKSRARRRSLHRPSGRSRHHGIKRPACWSYRRITHTIDRARHRTG
jgi:hypothetical protein